MATRIAERWAVRLNLECPELVSAAYLGLCLAALRIPRGHPFVGYARETIKGEILHELRSRRAVREHARLRESDALPVRLELADHPELERALESLAPRERDAVYRHIWLDESLAEVARAMGTGRPVACKTWYRALAKLRAALSG